MPFRLLSARRTVFLLALACLLGAAPAAPAAERTASLDGRRVSYEDLGRGAEAVVLVHGWSCDHTIWRAQLADLAGEFRVIAPDLPGHGRSDHPARAYTMAHLVRGLEAVLKAAKVRRVVLVGHSLGAKVASEYARRHPARVRGLVLVDGAILRAPAGPTAETRWREEAAALLAGLTESRRQEFLDGFLAPLWGPGIKPEQAAVVRGLMRATPLPVARSALKEFLDPAIWRVGPLGVPTLAIVARRPALPADQRELLLALYPRLEYLAWEGVGHFFMLETPERLNPLLLDYLRRHELQPRRR